MIKIDLITLSGITAMDGSLIASGATVKFGSEFQPASTKIRIIPMVYRNREMFEAGYSAIQISEIIIPYDFIIDVPEEEFYTLTPQMLYKKVCDWLNDFFGAMMFKLEMISE